MLNIVKHRRYYFLFSALVILPGVIAMIYSIVTTGAPVRLGIDFVGGSLFELQFEGEAPEADVRAVFAQFDLTDIILQELSPVGSEVPENVTRWQARTAFMASSRGGSIMPCRPRKTSSRETSS